MQSSEPRDSFIQTPNFIRKRPLRIGYVQLTDAAPFIVAGELGLYQKYGVRVELSRELGWATIENKVAYGDLDAAQALAAMPLSCTLGLGNVHCPMAAPLVTSRNGNAVTLSRDIWDRGVRTLEDFRAEIRSSRWQKMYVFGVVSLFSSHHFILRRWLRKARIDPIKDVRIVNVPPGQSLRNLRAGTLDGYCVGEPWNTLAVNEGLGWCESLSKEIEPDHPEKVLMLKQSFANERRVETEALVNALAEACSFCADPDNAERIANILHGQNYLSQSAETILTGLKGPFYTGRSERTIEGSCFSFGAGETNVPDLATIQWIIDGLKECGYLSASNLPEASLLEEVFRSDFLLNVAA